MCIPFEMLHVCFTFSRPFPFPEIPLSVKKKSVLGILNHPFEPFPQIRPCDGTAPNDGPLVRFDGV